ncbi:MAG: response regulator [Acidimicrobiales bacterium]
MTTQIKVIVADDDELDRYVAKRVLRKEAQIGTVGECGDGRQLIDLMRSPQFAEEWGPHPPPVLVLLDINMPLMSGFDVLNELSTPSPLVDADGATVTPEKVYVVLMLTSSVSFHDRQRAASHDLVVGYIEKPLDSVKLSRALAGLYPTEIGPDAAS